LALIKVISTFEEQVLTSVNYLHDFCIWDYQMRQYCWQDVSDWKNFVQSSVILMFYIVFTFHHISCT